MDLKTLKRNRSSFKSKLTLFKSFLQPLLLSKELNSLQNCELSTRLSKIQEMYTEFDNIQTDIENLSEASGDEFKEREAFESSYFGAVAAAQELLSRNQAASATHEDAQVTGSSSVSAHSAPNIKLPIISLPTFSGRYQDWLEYHDTFSSLIHTNNTIPKINKFHYLRASLKEGASLIIQSLDFSSDNYDVAWSLLCDRYNNNRLLVNNHINALFTIEQVYKESSKLLRNTLDTVNKNLRALKTLNLPTEHWDILIIHMVLGKLDQTSIREWEKQRNIIKDLPSLKDFNSFLKNRADLLETMEDAHNKPRRHSDITHVRPKALITHQAVSNQSQTNSFLCPICKQRHSIYFCYKFKSLPIEKRIEKVKELNLCNNCLRKGHDKQHCRLGPCKICSQKHNSLLHIHNNINTEDKASTSSECVVLPTLQTQAPAESQLIQPKITLSSIDESQVLLSTAIVNISDHQGQLHTVRVLLDNGSTSSFITESLRKQLNIPSYSTATTVQGLNNQSSRITQRCDITISSITNSRYNADVNCFIVPQITQIIPSTRINCKPFTIPTDIHLADPTFHVPSEVQILLGADLFWEVLLHNTMPLGKGKPTLVETKLGWLVSGSVPGSHTKKQTYNTVHCHFLHDIELEEKLDKFFELESISSAQQVHTKGESECETIFTNTTVRQPDGRFVVHIPLKESPTNLGDSKQQAITRFNALERKFKRNPIFQKQYIDFMNEYMALGHMTENTNIHKDEVSYFLPHHGVLREGSLSTKLRTVFDASAVTSSGKSYNNIQHIGSRGLNANQIKSSPLWWGGPHFLHQTEIQCPTQPQHTHTQNLPETKIQCNFTTSASYTLNIIQNYSNYSHLQRVTAYIKRFINNCKNSCNKIVGTLTVPELESSTQTLCKIAQNESFNKQYTQLYNKQTLSSKDKLLNLNPFFESSSGLIRVGGRLSNSNFDYDTKHPILLHASHDLTKLIVNHYHKRLLHAGPQLLLATLRHKFWIINGRNLTRKITHDCVKCCRFSGKTYQPIMGNLPEPRLHAEFPFMNTAVDYCGPVQIADRKGRGCRLKKAYICVFVCLAVRAIHIELVTELTSQGFLSALNRFIARRGKPAIIYSDNGTNFVGANNELNKLIKSASKDIISYSSENEINFKFSPAYSPHFNGLAEASVKSIKFHLKRVLGMAHLDYEEMNTVLVQIEAILNNRPITALSSDPSDLVPLKPADFLIGRSLTMLPSPQVQEDVPISTLSRYMRIQSLKTHFWNRFYKEYVSELQSRSKWQQHKGQPHPGDMVLIKDDRLPPNRWLLGRITAVYPGSDGINRVADVRTTSGTLRRAFNRLCPLPSPTLEQNVPRPAAC